VMETAIVQNGQGIWCDGGCHSWGGPPKNTLVKFEGYRGRDAQNRTSRPLPIRTAPDVIGQCPAIKLHQNSAPEQSVRLFLISATLSGTCRHKMSGTRLCNGWCIAIFSESPEKKNGNQKYPFGHGESNPGGVPYTMSECCLLQVGDDIWVGFVGQLDGFS
jgi:hypothetical protein